MKRKPKEAKRPSAREYAVASGLNRGLSMQQACMEAGFTRSYSRSFAHKIARRVAVAQAQAELGKKVMDNLGFQAAYTYCDVMADPKSAKRERLTAARGGAEMSGYIGSSPAALHLHAHKHEQRIPQEVIALILEDMREIQAKKNGAVLDAPARPEPIPPQLTAPKPDPPVQAETIPEPVPEPKAEYVITKEALTRGLLKKFSNLRRIDAEKMAEKALGG